MAINKSMANQLFLYFPIFVALYIITKHFLNKFQNLPPSPFPSLPIIGHLYLLKKPIHRTVSHISNRYGPVVLLQLGSRRVVFVSSPSIVEECFTTNDIIFANRPPLITMKYISYNYTTLTWSPYGDHWRNVRKIVSIEVLSVYRLQMLSSMRLQEVKLLICRLIRSQNQILDMRSAFFELTLNIMMLILVGKRYYGENVSDVEEAKGFQAIHAELVRVAGQGNIGDYLPWIKSKKTEKRVMESWRKIDSFIQCLVEDQRRKLESSSCGATTNNMIQHLLSFQKSEPEYYKDDIIKGLMLVFLLAGTDTSINTMEWALSLLLNHPEVLKKAQIEIDKHIGHERLIDEADIAQLPYLRSIINETWRMYPPAALPVPHQSSKECMVGGFRIPSGTILYVNLWAIHNDPKIWIEPRKFKPERFEGLEGTRDGFRLMPFGYGRRSCPGEGLAMRVVGLTLGSIIQCFEWRRIGDKMVDMSEGCGFGMSKAQPLKAICQPRPCMLKLLSLQAKHATNFSRNVD